MDSFDMKKFSGEWYEIAHTNHDLSECDKNAILSFSGNVRTNRCYTRGQLQFTITRELYWKDPNSQSKMTVTKTGKEIWVYYTDYTTSAILGDESGSYVWILSRSATVPVCTYKSLVERASQKGLDVQSLKTDLGVLTGCGK